MKTKLELLKLHIACRVGLYSGAQILPLLELIGKRLLYHSAPVEMGEAYIFRIFGDAYSRRIQNHWTPIYAANLDLVKSPVACSVSAGGGPERLPFRSL